MIWALLAILGVPIWLILGALIGGSMARRRFINTPASYPCVCGRSRAGAASGAASAALLRITGDDDLRALPSLLLGRCWTGR